MMSYQYRNEEAFVFRAEMRGPYGKTKDVQSDFRKYHRAAERNGLLPKSLKGKFVHSAYAKRRCGQVLEKM